MLRSLFHRRNPAEDLGLDKKPGDPHYRAYVGPPADYDLIAAMVFNLLTTLGLRQQHKLLDIGCGSLRVGRLLIPYLNEGNYFGVEPNRWLVKAGIRHEIGWDLVKIKKPNFFYGDSLSGFGSPMTVDYAVAQSIFSHCGADLIEGWLAEVSAALKENGALLATAILGEEDCEEQGWIYPGVVSFSLDTLRHMALRHDLRVTLLDWAHPRQTWLLFAKPDFESCALLDGTLSWNRLVRGG